MVFYLDKWLKYENFFHENILCILHEIVFLITICLSVIFSIPQYEDGILFSQMANTWEIFVCDKIIVCFILQEDCIF